MQARHYQIPPWLPGLSPSGQDGALLGLVTPRDPPCVALLQQRFPKAGLGFYPHKMKMPAAPHQLLKPYLPKVARLSALEPSDVSPGAPVHTGCGLFSAYQAFFPSMFLTAGDTKRERASSPASGMHGHVHSQSDPKAPKSSHK